MSHAAVAGLDAAAWTAVGTLGLVAIGTLAAGVGLRQLVESRATARDVNRAYVSADFESHPENDQVIEFVLRNTGRTAAWDISFKWQPVPVRVVEMPGQEFAKARLFQGIPLLGPNREIRIFFDLTTDRFNAADLVSIFVLCVQYTDRFGTKHADNFVLDADLMKGTATLGTKSMTDLAKATESIAKVLQQSGFASGDLNVVTEDRKTRDKRVSEAFGRRVAQHEAMRQRLLERGRPDLVEAIAASEAGGAGSPGATTASGLPANRPRPKRRVAR